jgi:hypothetical protein
MSVADFERPIITFLEDRAGYAGLLGSPLPTTFDKANLRLGKGADEFVVGFPAETSVRNSMLPFRPQELRSSEAQR